MKAGIITFHNGSNYGASLQTFALQEAIKKEGLKVKIINYENRFISKGLNIIRIDPSLRGIYYAISDIMNIPHNYRKINRFRHFFLKYYDLTKPYSYNDLKTRGLLLDYGISGSDQIWNPLLQGKIDDIYFLGFPGIKNKISYGSSVGSYKFDNSKYNTEMKYLLSDFEKIAVREKSVALENVIRKKTINVCDPTLLLDMKDWEKKFNLKKNKERYLLIYAMTDFKRIVEYSVKVGNCRGLKIKYIGNRIGSRKKGVEYINDAGPIEFVKLFYGAEYIVTNSFHGTAFSVNFKKQFISIINPKSPERAQCFLEQIGALERLIDYDQKIPADINEIDYQTIHSNLDNYIIESKAFLYNALRGE